MRHFLRAFFCFTYPLLQILHLSDTAACLPFLPHLL